MNDKISWIKVNDLVVQGWNQWYFTDVVYEGQIGSEDVTANLARTPVVCGYLSPRNFDEKWLLFDKQFSFARVKNCARLLDAEDCIITDDSLGMYKPISVNFGYKTVLENTSAWEVY